VRKIKEVLRLKFDVGLGLRQIARSCSIGLGTAHEYLQRAEAAKITWPLGPEWDDDRLEAALFGGPPRSRPTVMAMPDFADLHRQRQQHSHITQQLLWEEYRQANPDGYKYSRFCELYQRWRRKQDVVLRQEHKAGEKLFVDWAGTTIPIHDPRGGPAQQAHLFVAVLGASSYTYAETTADEQLASWIGAHVRAFEFYEGVPKLVVPDNTKTGVTKACRYDPDLNPTYQEMAMHYGVGVVPARPYKPRDKAKVESGVQLAERWIIAALRHRKFFSIEELNQAIRELRDRINQRPFRQREGSRASQFVAVDKPALSPLPTERFDLSEWSRARVNIDYHIAFDTNYYSVPYNGQSAILGCLTNGQGNAAALLAARGARLNLETAAGAGRMDVVQSFFTDDGKLKPPATQRQLQRGFLWACEFGHLAIAEFLLDRGADLRDQAETSETGLHWAVVGCQLPVVQFLLNRGAPLEELNAYGGTALGQAGWCFENAPALDFYPIFEVLLAAGAEVEDGCLQWLEKVPTRPPSEKVRLANLLRRYGART
jgi:transposase/ankyrin repeat protein